MDHFEAARCALGPVLAVMAGWVAPLVHIGDSVKRIQIYQRTLSSISDAIWMRMVDCGLRLVSAMLSMCCPRFLCVPSSLSNTPHFMHSH